LDAAGSVGGALADRAAIQASLYLRSQKSSVLASLERNLAAVSILGAWQNLVQVVGASSDDASEPRASQCQQALSALAMAYTRVEGTLTMVESANKSLGALTLSSSGSAADAAVASAFDRLRSDLSVHTAALQSSLSMLGPLSALANHWLLPEASAAPSSSGSSGAAPSEREVASSTSASSTHAQRRNAVSWVQGTEEGSQTLFPLASEEQELLRGVLESASSRADRAVADLAALAGKRTPAADLGILAAPGPAAQCLPLHSLALLHFMTGRAVLAEGILRGVMDSYGALPVGGTPLQLGGNAAVRLTLSQAAALPESARFATAPLPLQAQVASAVYLQAYLLRQWDKRERQGDKLMQSADAMALRCVHALGPAPAAGTSAEARFMHLHRSAEAADAVSLFPAPRTKAELRTQFLARLALPLALETISIGSWSFTLAEDTAAVFGEVERLAKARKDQVSTMQ
jgi:hypothetical protein